MKNRENRRKQKSKNEKRIIISEEDSENMPSLVKICIIITVVFVAFYAITLLLANISKVNNTASNDNENNTPVTIQYDEILAGETFKMNVNEYYVIFYDFEASEAGTYENLISNYKTNHTNGKIYTVDLSKGFNTLYTSKTSNPSVGKIDDLKVKGPTLIKIINGLNVSYSEGYQSIKVALQ